ncbi:MAG: GNAT family N-acetyltransferase [Clostridia bacterium]|nr:GNAT family N-acetyltransferase [Clostridia bacterium]
MKENRLSTNRLFLFPISYQLACSMLLEENKALEKLGLKTNGNWPQANTLDMLCIAKKNLKKKINDGALKLWMIVKKSDMSIIGDIGFKGRICEKGKVEIGCALIEEERGKGYGYETTKTLLDWVLSKEEIIAVKAKCYTHNTSSIKVLKKCGMSELKRDTKIIHWYLEKHPPLYLTVSEHLKMLPIPN